MLTRKVALRAPVMLSACVAGSLLFGTVPAAAKFFVGVEAVYMQAEDEQDYAVEVFGPGGEVVVGPVARAGFDQDWALRGTIGTNVTPDVELSLNG